MVARKRLNGAPPPLADDPVALGREAWERRKADARASWEDWLAIGEALMVGRQQAMAEANTNRPAGKGYNQQFHHWLQIHGFDDIDGSDRSKLMWLIDRRDEVEEWRAEMTPGQRAAWNHPSTVARVAKCAERGLPSVKKTSTSGGSKAKGGSKGKNANWAGTWVVEANKSAGVARDARKFRGDVSPALIEAARSAAQAWSDTADRFEARALETADDSAAARH